MDVYLYSFKNVSMLVLGLIWMHFSLSRYEHAIYCIMQYLGQWKKDHTRGLASDTAQNSTLREWTESIKPAQASYFSQSRLGRAWSIPWSLVPSEEVMATWNLYHEATQCPPSVLWPPDQETQGWTSPGELPAHMPRTHGWFPMCSYFCCASQLHLALNS